MRGFLLTKITISDLLFPFLKLTNNTWLPVVCLLSLNWKYAEEKACKSLQCFGSIRHHSSVFKMRILQDLLASLPGDVLIRSALVGPRWTVVCSRYCGIAATLASDLHGGVPGYDVGHLQKKSAPELAELALASNLLEASIGVAAINSMLEVDETLAVEINASEVLASHGRGRTWLWLGVFASSHSYARLRSYRPSPPAFR
jgi:hypothetical protein